MLYYLLSTGNKPTTKQQGQEAMIDENELVQSADKRKHIDDLLEEKWGKEFVEDLKVLAQKVEDKILHPYYIHSDFLDADFTKEKICKWVELTWGQWIDRAFHECVGNGAREFPEHFKIEECEDFLWKWMPKDSAWAQLKLACEK